MIQRFAAIFLAVVLTFLIPTQAFAEIKVLLCTGDYGMWAQDRVKLIEDAVAKAAPQQVSFESEQSFNFVKKLEAPGYAERFDVIVAGDIAVGQMTTECQAALVQFVKSGGGFVYVEIAKSGIPVHSSREVDPLPLISILPYEYPDTAKAVADASKLTISNALFQGLDFSKTPIMTPAKAGEAAPQDPLFAVERPEGKGHVAELFGAFSADYQYISYATYKKSTTGWDTWPQLGDFWVRYLTHMAEGSPVKQTTRAAMDAAAKSVPLQAHFVVNAAKEIDDIRAADFSIVALQQLYNEDGGNGEDQFFALNPQDFLDRHTQEVLPNKLGKFPDKTVLFKKYNMHGIIMGNNAYGSFFTETPQQIDQEVAADIAAAKQYPDILTYLQPGNEPPCDENYFKFHNKFAKGILEGAPNLKVIGPNASFNLEAPDDKKMKAFIEECGANTDVLNWHIYARCPESVINEVKYWTKYADGKLRSKGPVKVMFTEADAWDTEDSQFNYLMDRGFTFLNTPEIIACFQYCMRPRFEGGTYWFGVLQSPNNEKEFSATYNGFWIWRNLRGRMIQSISDGPIRTQGGPRGEDNPPGQDAAYAHCRVIASTDGGNKVTAVAYFDTGIATAAQRSDSATISLSVQLPPGNYKLERSDASWNVRKVTPVDGVVSGTVNVEATLAPCQAAAFTWTKQ